MFDWTEGDVITNGMRMHYYRTGDGTRPPVVLCHGFSDSGLCWTPTARALEVDYDVTMIDARGHGKSEAPEGDYGPVTMATDLAGLIQALGLRRPFVMGHSMGGATTLNLCVHFPELVSKAALEDGGAYDLTIARDPSSAAPPNPVEQWAGQTLEQVIAAGRAQSPRWGEAEFEPWAQAKLNLRPQGAGVMARQRPPWREAFARVQCPLLLIRADNALGSVVTPEAAAEAMRINPLVRVVHISGAGHNVRREQFGAFIAAVRAFLAE
ncbi:MAG: alpha/beta fold hydrolase [Anaerolineae bacterium]